MKRILLFVPAFLCAAAIAGRAEITYTRDIAPIVQARCVECHRPGEPAPFALETYRDVQRRARTIAKVLEEGYMPPWHAFGGDVPLVGDRRLATSELDTILTWIKSGAPEGNPAHLPAPRQFPEGWRLGKPDLILEMDEAFALPAEGPDIYRNFVIPTRMKKEKWLVAIEFKPGTPQVVHHCLFYLDTSDAARSADDADPAPGFAEMPLGAGIGRPLGGWVPGSLPLPLPEGLAHHLPAGADIVLSTHFHLSGKPETERSKIGLYFSGKPPEKEFTAINLPPLFGAFAGVDIAPGDQRATLTDSFELPVAVEAFGATAHAHYLGKSLRLTAQLPNGEETVLLNVPDWDFAWQEEYRFATNVLLPAGTRLVSNVSWDNSAENPNNPVLPPVRVRWGRQSFDEMGSLTLLVSTENSKDLKTLDRRYSEHLRWQAGSHLLSPEKLKFAAGLRENALARFDADGNGELNAEERARARARLESTADGITGE